MSRYDGLIIPRSYSEYINKTGAATLSQELQLSGVMDNAPTAGSNNPVKSGGVKTELEKYINKTDAATLQQALQLSGVLSGAVAAGDNKAVKSSAVATALAGTNSFIESVGLNIVNNTTTKKIILLGVMEPDTPKRAGVNLDITYRRVDVVGRIFATLKADDESCKYFYLSTGYKPIIIKKTRITANKKYNVYLIIDSYTPLTRVIINAPLSFTLQGVEKSALEGTEVAYTPVDINDL